MSAGQVSGIRQSSPLKACVCHVIIDYYYHITFAMHEEVERTEGRRASGGQKCQVVTSTGKQIIRMPMITSKSTVHSLVYLMSNFNIY